MKIKVDWEADVLYIRFDEESELEVAEEVGDEVVLDLDEQERIVGLEVLNLRGRASRRVAYATKYSDRVSQSLRELPCTKSSSPTGASS